jgi:hypothetical protein
MARSWSVVLSICIKGQIPDFQIPDFQIPKIQTCCRQTGSKFQRVHHESYSAAKNLNSAFTAVL